MSIILMLSACQERYVFKQGEIYSARVNQAIEDAPDLKDYKLFSLIEGFLVVSNPDFEGPFIVNDRKTFKEGNFNRIIYLDIEKDQIASCNEKPVSVTGNLKNGQHKVWLEDIDIWVQNTLVIEEDYEDLGITSAYQDGEPILIDCNPINSGLDKN